jgi:hypothetical protein
MILGNSMIAAFFGPSDILVLLVLALPIAACVFWIVELIDCIRRIYPEPSTKIVWVLVILFLHFIGAGIYYFVGKKSGHTENE